jgi:hypothetical protein
MLVHFCTFKSFLLYYNNKTGWGEGQTDDDMMNWTRPMDFSKTYHDDYAAASPTTPWKL